MPATMIDGHRLNLTHLDKVLYPDTGTSKGQVIEYLKEIAPAMLPHLSQRPVTRKRWPDGVDSDYFFERQVPPSIPQWVPRFSVHHQDRTVDYPLVDSTAGLALMGQLAALELHVPQWTVVKGKPGPVTRLIFDLDPGEGVELYDCARVALAVREYLTAVGLSSYPVTSGSKGIHVYAELITTLDSEPSQFAQKLAKQLAKDWPELVTATMAKTERSGKVFVDWSQNNPAKTTVAPYSLRGRAEPTAAAPRDWSELEEKGLRQLRFDEARTMSKRRRPVAEVSGLAPHLSIQTSSRPDTRADARTVDRRARVGFPRRTQLRHPGTSCDQPALGLPTRTRRCSRLVGGAEGGPGQTGNQPSRRSDRRPPARLPDVLGNHP